ncbi:MAG: transposase [Candidatus Acidiferrales bacterium]
MPPPPKRPKRHKLERRYGLGHLHFITCSCYRRLPFFASERRRDVFLKILQEVRDRYDFALLGYVVMPEHIHLLISEPNIGTLSLVMQVLKQRVSRGPCGEGPSRAIRHRQCVCGRTSASQNIRASGSAASTISTFGASTRRTRN